MISTREPDLFGASQDLLEEEDVHGRKRRQVGVAVADKEVLEVFLALSHARELDDMHSSHFLTLVHLSTLYFY